MSPDYIQGHAAGLRDGLLKAATVIDTHYGFGDLERAEANGKRLREAAARVTVPSVAVAELSVQPARELWCALVALVAAADPYRGNGMIFSECLKARELLARYPELGKVGDDSMVPNSIEHYAGARPEIEGASKESDPRGRAEVTDADRELVKEVQHWHNDNVIDGQPAGDWHIQSMPDHAARAIALYRHRCVQQVAESVQRVKRERDAALSERDSLREKLGASRQDAQQRMEERDAARLEFAKWQKEALATVDECNKLRARGVTLIDETGADLIQPWGDSTATGRWLAVDRFRMSISRLATGKWNAWVYGFGDFEGSTPWTAVDAAWSVVTVSKKPEA